MLGSRISVGFYPEAKRAVAAATPKNVAQRQSEVNMPLLTGLQASLSGGACGFIDNSKMALRH